MRIIINSWRENAETTVFAIPTGLVCNRLGAKLAVKKLSRLNSDNKHRAALASKNTANISTALATKAVAELNRFRRVHKDFVFIEVQSADDFTVKIIL